MRASEERHDERGGALVVDVRVRRGTFALDVALTAGPGQVVAVLGPNGAGKSTLLAAVAGTLRVRDGVVRVGDRVLTHVPHGPEPARNGHVHVRVERRSVGLLGQDPLVFPHLTARENVAFGPRAAGVAAADARLEADEWLRAVGLGDLTARRPDELSGGQRQRVALARALAARPAALLLDEPFAQLDVRTVAELRDLVREHVRAAAVPTVLVTHDVVDALALADHVVVLHEGSVVEQGDPVAVLTDPVHPFTAALADLDLLRGELRGGRLRTAELDVALPRAAGSPDDGHVQVTFSPGDVRVVGVDHGSRTPSDDPSGALGAEVEWRSVVIDVERGPRGVRVRTTQDVLVDVAAADAVALDLRPGSPVTLRVARTAVRVRAL